LNVNLNYLGGKLLINKIKSRMIINDKQNISNLDLEINKVFSLLMKSKME